MEERGRKGKKGEERGRERVLRILEEVLKNDTNWSQHQKEVRKHKKRC